VILRVSGRRRWSYRPDMSTTDAPVPARSGSSRDPGQSVDERLTAGSHTADVAGNRLHYEVRGSGPVLLFPSPGWGPSISYLLPQPALERHCTVVYFDTRHSGESTGPEEADQYTLAHFVSDIEGLRQYLGAPRVFLAGHSAGGQQVLAHGIEHSEHLLGIIAVDAIAAPDDLRTRELLAAMDRRRTHPFYRARPGFVDTAVAIMTGADRTPRSITEKLEAIGPFYFHDPELAASVMPTLRVDETVNRYADASGFQGDDVLADLHRITVPTLVIVGDDDFICDPVSQAARIAERIPSSTLVTIEDSGHVPWAEQPARFDAACDTWLAEVTRARDEAHRRDR
jgi:proline iminopeptidase